jgi:HK97 family phage prohead protease
MYQMFFLGAAHPVGHDEDYKGVTLRRSDVETLTENPLNIPLFYEHEYDYGPIGEILMACVDDQGKPIVVGYIDISLFWGAIAFAEVKNGTIVGMSLGFRYLADDSTGDVIWKQVFEVSLTSQPALADTSIIFCAGIPLSLRKTNIHGRSFEECKKFF